jgi:hypothetical protein
MELKFIDIDLDLVVKGNSILAHLVFTNNTTKNLMLDKFIICYNNSIRNNLFKILDGNNRRIDYLGPLVKRYITKEDFISVSPGEMIETSITLNEVYEVKNGKKYTIQFSAYHPTNIEGSEITKIESNSVEIDF